MTLEQEYREKYEAMYQDLKYAIMVMSGYTPLGEGFPGLDSMIGTKAAAMQASVQLGLSELIWLESQMWQLRRIFLDQTDVLENERVASVLITIETILEKVLLAFAGKYLDREDESKLSFLTADEGVFDNNE